MAAVKTFHQLPAIGQEQIEAGVDQDKVKLRTWTNEVKLRTFGFPGGLWIDRVGYI